MREQAKSRLVALITLDSQDTWTSRDPSPSGHALQFFYCVAALFALIRFTEGMIFMEKKNNVTITKLFIKPEIKFES